jgi:hypothetical protein
LEILSTAPVRIIGASQVGISSTVTPIPTELCFITQQFEMKYQHHVQISIGKTEKEDCNYEVEEPSYVANYDTRHHYICLVISSIWFH